MVRRNQLMPSSVSSPSENNIRGAIHEVLSGSLSIRKASVAFNLSRSTLAIYVKKFKVLGRLPHADEPVKVKQTNHHSQIIPPALETELARFLTASSVDNNGLSPNVAQIFTYWFAVVNQISLPVNWNLKQKASLDWLKGFLKRHPSMLVHCNGRKGTWTHKY